MIPVLTTITPHWNREEMLRLWLENLNKMTFPDLKHIVFLIGPVPDWITKEYSLNPQFQFIYCRDDSPGQFSIGHYHNQGAHLASSEWIMKLDLDALPNVRYFSALLALLEQAQPKEWFNGGMIYINQAMSVSLLGRRDMPLSADAYQWIMKNRESCSSDPYTLPAATNFICRRKDYLELGGCDEKFQGYGWEDYQQIYMLERHWLGKHPLVGMAHLANVTQKCRDEISRPKAKQLWERNEWLVLLHHWHPRSRESAYRNPITIQKNRQLLLDHILDYES